MRVYFFVHPISGDVAGNLQKAKEQIKRYHEANPTHVLLAPWITECEMFDDDNPAHRMAGIARNLAVISRCDGVVVAAGQISPGMHVEILHAERKKLEIIRL